MSEITAAVIGAGLLGSRHAKDLATHPRVRVCGVADRIRERAERVASAAGANAYESDTSLLDRERPDVLVVATPDAFHAEPVRNAVKAGIRRLIIEKPLATRLDEAEELAELFKKEGVTAYVNYANRFLACERATRWCTQRRIVGTPVHAEFRLDDNIGVPTQMWGEESAEWIASSSTAHFLLSHITDLQYYFFAPESITRVYAVAARRLLKSTPDCYDVLITWSSDLISRMEAGWIRRMPRLVEAFLSISYTAGTIVYNKLPGYRQQLGWRCDLAHDYSSSEINGMAEELNSLGIPVTIVREYKQESPIEGSPWALEITENPSPVAMHLYADAFLEETDQPSSWKEWGGLPDWRDALEAVRVCTAVEQSSRDGGPVDL